MTNAPSFKRDRPTIGVLAGWSIPEGSLPDHYRTLIVQGMQSAARSRQCHLLLGWGNRIIERVDRFHSSWPEASSETDFIPVGPWNTDGLIVFSPLGSQKQSRYLLQLRAQGFPVVFIASGEQGPHIAINSELGIHQAIAHLVEHGHRRIAFVAGQPSDEGDSQTRLRAYHAAVMEYDLDSDPGLVVWGWHDFMEGYHAVRGLIQSNIKFTAILASNDNSAIGAMQAIHDAKLEIPGQVAIIGFDNYPGAIAQTPPLTSVHVPLNLIGEQALLLMADHLQKGTVLASIRISPRLVKRQSCGCRSNALSATAIADSLDSIPLAGSPANANVQQMEQQVVSDMMSTLSAELRFPDENQIQSTCTAFVRAFYTSLGENNPGHFESAFTEAIHKLELMDANIDYWQEIISNFRRAIRQLPLAWDQEKTRLLAEHILHQARVMIAESAQRQYHRHEHARNMDAGALNLVTARLSVALSNAEVAEVLNTYVPQIGIRHARFMFFEAERGDPVAWSVAPGPLEDGSLDKRFRSREFPPPGLYAPEELLNIILFPLVFQGEVLGCAALDASNIESCTVIARQLAATIKVSRLHAQVVELSLTDPLTGLYNRRYLDLFLEKEIARGHRFLNKLSVVMADIDHFKNYNDQFGHPAGDLALQQVARCLTRGRRTTDVITRIGGEEFAILLPETDMEGALICAEKMRLSIAAISSLKRPITISLGIATFNQDIYIPEILLQQADLALYEAKKAGRNRVCVYRGG